MGTVGPVLPLIANFFPETGQNKFLHSSHLSCN
jgi:hypothetical protein